jgi:hypothetical protein
MQWMPSARVSCTTATCRCPSSRRQLAFRAAPVAQR